MPREPAAQLPDRIATDDEHRTAIEWLNVHGGIDRRDAYALVAMALSFRVTQAGQPDRLGLSSDRQRMIRTVFPKLVLGGRVAGRTPASMDPNL